MATETFQLFGDTAFNSIADGFEGTTYDLKLFTNDATVTFGISVSSLTECTDSTYVKGTLTFAVTQGSSAFLATSTDTHSFTFSASQNIYGAYITDPDNSDGLVGVAKFSAMQAVTGIDFTGGVLTLTPA